MSQVIVDEIIARAGGLPGNLVSILKEIQKRFNYLPPPALRRVAETTRISAADIESVATFYPGFRMEPAGLHTVQICIGTACFVKGADQIFDAFRETLEIADGRDTDPGGLFTLEKVACLGCCMLAPAVRIDNLVYGHLTRGKVPSVLKSFLESKHSGEEGTAVSTGEQAVHGEVRLCTCTSCRASGADAVYQEFFRQHTRNYRQVALKRVGCNGSSYNAPSVVIDTQDPAAASVQPPAVYHRVTPAMVGELLWKHFRPKRLDTFLAAGLSRLARRFAGETVVQHVIDADHTGDSQFLAAQVRIVTEGADERDPLDLDGYIDSGGFAAYRSLVESSSPEHGISILRDSGLRGRGGAGFPAWQKWSDVISAPGEEKYVVCNADEGDPGAFMDRMILESFPFRVLDGLATAAWVVGADTAIMYVRSEYPLAARTAELAVDACERAGLLAVKIEIREGAGAFVCGEETALLSALEGRRPNPRFRPPYPGEIGYNGMPTLVQNVETLANVPWIFANGAKSFLAIGTPGSPGTKTFALAGKVRRGGLVEVPTGMTLLEIVNGLGGGVEEGRTLKAIQIGGPSGGCIPADLGDLPVDYEGLSAAGAMMGSGGIIALDDSDCMVDLARYFMEFTQAESCGKCTCCRIGTRRMLDILKALCEGRANDDDLHTLESLCMIVSSGSLCGLGKTAPNPVLTSLRYFRDEYTAHLKGRCPAGRCRQLVKFFITDRCIGCTRCAQNCPVDAIAPTPYERHRIDPDICIRCGTCKQVCPSRAVEVR